MQLVEEAKAYIEQTAEAIGQALEIDTTIVDQNCLRVGGTGRYRHRLGLPIPHGSFYRQIMVEKVPKIILDNRESFACQECEEKEYCQELATLAYPIVVGNEAIGVMGLIAFTKEQQKRMEENGEKWLGFLGNMSSLLQSKLELLTKNRLLAQQFEEAISSFSDKHAFQHLVGDQPNFLALLEKAQKAAAGNANILITGESGTGKELLARAIHSAGSRSSKPFIAVNCAGIPEHLLESELFGYEKGAFTGAGPKGKPGKFEMAQEGTLFLDEIGDLPYGMQPKLLRVLQERTIDRLGGLTPLPLNVRIIAATNKDLGKMVKNGEFREELYYRLHVIPLTLPPLRKRRRDIPLLAQFFLEKHDHLLGGAKHQFSLEVLRAMERYDWPGNIRQLENAVEYMVNMARTPIIGLSDLPENLGVYGETRKEADTTLVGQLAEYEKGILQTMLAGKTSLEEKLECARALGISQASLYRKMKLYGIK